MNGGKILSPYEAILCFLSAIALPFREQSLSLCQNTSDGQRDLRATEGICRREEAVDATALRRARLLTTADVYGDRGATYALRRSGGP